MSNKLQFFLFYNLGIVCIFALEFIANIRTPNENMKTKISIMNL